MTPDQLSGARDRGHLEVRLFGSCRIFRNGVEVTLSAPKPAAALKVLVLRGGVIHKDKLVAALWPDEDLAVGRGRLRNVLSKVRRATGARIQERNDTVRILDTVSCDIVEFVTIASRAIAEVEDTPQRRRLCVQAQALWVAPPLEEDCFAEWAKPHRDLAFQLQRSMWALLPEGQAAPPATPAPRRGPRRAP